MRTNIYFAGKLIWSDNAPVYQDRLGTHRALGARYYPYGDEITSTPNDREKFATYTRDSFTGLDYADQRYYVATYGRFMTPDPSRRSARMRNPGSWNPYAYTLGDPVNGSDPTGLDDCDWSCIFFGGYSNEGTQAYMCMCNSAAPVYDSGYLGNSYPSSSGYENPNATGNGAYTSTTVTFDGGGADTTSNFQQLPPEGPSPSAVVGTSVNAVSGQATVSLGPVGAVIGGALAGPAGAIFGFAIGEEFGLGAAFSCISSTQTWYVGPTLVFTPGTFGGSGASFTGYNFPTVGDAGQVLGGGSIAITRQPTPVTGVTATYSPGSAPVFGPTVATGIPISIGVGYGICIYSCR